jgi:rhamnogalacturonan endolyase
MRYLLLLVLLLGWGPALGQRAYALDAAPVTVTEDARQLVMDNGTVVIEFSKARAALVSIRYRHDGQTTELSKTMYYSHSAGPVSVAGAGKVTTARPTALRLVQNTPEAAEVAMEDGPTPAFPFHREVHYRLPRGESGFYAYQIYRRDADQPAAFLGEARFVIKGPPGTGLFTHHVVDAERMGPFPTSPTVRQVSDATFLLADGSIYTKYNNSAFLGNHFVHGMTGHGVGIWMINGSNEFVNGGPIKQELTVHMDNTLLNMLQGGHYGSGELDFKQNEPWTKFYGPIFVYMNHVPARGTVYDDEATARVLHADAVKQTALERSRWPYAWVQNADYPTARGAVTGALHLTDGSRLTGVTVVLAAPGGDWPLQGKGYEFWANVRPDGQFTIPKVRPGTYTLYAYGANQFEQYEYNDVTIAANRTLRLGRLEWKPVTHGRTLWRIGVADRGTQEFKNGDDVRHFANYLRYGTDFPDDVTFTVGRSKERTDWNFAQWTWYCKRPYWTVRFDLPQAPQAGHATLTLGIAASVPLHGRDTNLEIKVNGTEVGTLHLPKSGPAGYRSGGQDSAYRVEYVRFDAALLKAGTNELTLGHQDAEPIPPQEEQLKGRVGVVMYDALRLEVGE